MMSNVVDCPPDDVTVGDARARHVGAAVRRTAPAAVRTALGTVDDLAQERLSAIHDRMDASISGRRPRRSATSCASGSPANRPDDLDAASTRAG